MKRGQRLFALLALTLVPLLMACGAWAEDIHLRGEVGYGGFVLFGRVNPLVVEISGGDEEISGVVSTQVYIDMDQYNRIDLPVRIAAGETVSVRMPVCPLVPQQTFDVALRDDAGSELARTSVTASRSVDRETLLIGVMDEDGEALAGELAQRARERLGKKGSLRALALDAESFPVSETELTAFDALLIDAFDPSQLSETQQSALTVWVERGGVVLLGEGHAESSALAWFAQRKGLEPTRLTADTEGAALEYLVHMESKSSASNYRLYMGATGMQRVSRDVDIGPAALLLAAYVIVVGFGLYAVLRRGDRRQALWGAIPVCALLGVGAMLGVSRMLELDEPALSSVLITVYDEEGRAYTEEQAALSYADETRVTIGTENGEAVERRLNRYLSSYMDVNMTPTELKDVITLGDAPAIELYATAPWVTRELVIRNERVPQGDVEGRAFMGEDGLHVEVANRTDMRLEDAVLLTGLGYLRAGDIEPGEERAFILKRETLPFIAGKDPVIREGLMTPYTLEQGQFISQCVNPELEDDPDFKTSQLSEEEQYLRSLSDSLLGTAIQSSKALLPCSLIARTSVPCTRLTLNGKPIERMAQSSLLVKNIRFETRTQDGRFYEPLGTFEAWNAYQDEGQPPRMLSPVEQTYMESDQDILLGYDLGELRPGDATEIRVVIGDRHSWRGGSLSLSVYDHVNGKWTAIDSRTFSMISGGLVQRVIGEDGSFFLRVSDLDSGSIDVPQIVVEGVLAPRDEEEQTREEQDMQPQKPEAPEKTPLPGEADAEDNKNNGTETPGEGKNAPDGKEGSDPQ